MEHAGGADKAAHMATMKRLLEGCRGLVPGMGAFEVGLAAPGLEATCDVVLVSEFGSAAALEACQRHPQHLAIRPFIGAVHAERQGVDDEV
jgi:hypothetical protein